MIGGVLLLFLVTEAYVDFPHSRIYDEFDFAGQPSVTIDGFCTNTCRIYVSITPESFKPALNLLFQLPKGFVSAAEVATGTNETTLQKIPLVVNNAAKLNIINANAQYAAGPLVIYVIDDQYSRISGAEVYEADGFHRPMTQVPSFVTVMSARPFTISQEGSPTQAAGVSAIMGGYVDMDSGICPYLDYMKYDNYPGFVWQINGPIISIKWDTRNFDFPTGDITATTAIDNKLPFARSGWVGSPGYHGCKGQKPFRSSLYDFSSPMQFEIANDEDERITFEVVTNSDDAHAVNLTDRSTGVHYSIRDSEENRVTFTFASSKDVLVEWNPDGNGDIGFFARWHSPTL